MLTIWITHKGREYALEKTTSRRRADAVFGMCELHLGELFPDATLSMSERRHDFERLEMHPEKQEIFSRMWASEFPLPAGEDIIEGFATVLEDAV